MLTAVVIAAGWMMLGAIGVIIEPHRAPVIGAVSGAPRLSAR